MGMRINWSHEIYEIWCFSFHLNIILTIFIIFYFNLQLSDIITYDYDIQLKIIIWRAPNGIRTNEQLKKDLKKDPYE